MKLEYTGKQVGSITFMVLGRTIRAGNNSRDRLIEVSEAEGAALLRNHGALFRKAEAAEVVEVAAERAAPESGGLLDALRGAGLKAATVEALGAAFDEAALRVADDEALLAIEGIGPATLLKLREALRE